MRNVFYRSARKADVCRGVIHYARNCYWVKVAHALKRARVVVRQLLKLNIAALLFFGCAASCAFAAPAQPLPPEQAFRFSVRALDSHTLEAQWSIAEGYYLYRDKFSFSVEPASVRLGQAQIPAGELKNDENFGSVAVFHQAVSIRIPIATAPLAGASLTLKATSQGCWEGGVCYPPLDQSATVVLPAQTSGLDDAAKAADKSSSPASLSANAVVAPPQASLKQPSAAKNTDESSRIAELLKFAPLWLILLSFFGFGLALAFTPCMLPMLPILAALIVRQDKAVSHARAGALAASYVLGMAATYAAIGVAAGLSGQWLSAALQSAWVLAAFALVFVALALSMFGWYELQLPTLLQTRLSAQANRQTGGNFLATALMGALSALIVGPCVAAPLAGALLYIAHSRDVVLGGSALMVMALGMGAPLVAISLFSRRILPNSGPWMEAVKQGFGVLLLAVALWLVTPVLPAWLSLLGLALLLIFSAIQLRAVDALPPDASGWQRLWKGVGVVLLLYGAALFIGLLAGSRDPLQPLGFIAVSSGAAPTTPAAAHPPFARVGTTAELDAAIKSSSRPVLLDFYADWCVSCIEMEKFTFSDPRVAQKMREFTLLQVDVTAYTPADKELLRRFALIGPPGVLLFDKNGQEARRVVGFMTADAFLRELQAVQ